MFPQFIFLASIPKASPQYDQRLLGIKKDLSFYDGRYDVVVVAGSVDSLRLGYELFGKQRMETNNQNGKKLLFVQGNMKDRVLSNVKGNTIDNLSESQRQQYGKLYRNWSDFISQQQQDSLQSNQGQFIKRIVKLKQDLFHYRDYSGVGMVLVIGDRGVLDYLGATDYHGNGEPVNRLHLREGEMDVVGLVVEGEQRLRQLQRQGLFCG